MAAVNLVEVNKAIGKNQILTNINLNIEKGEFVTVVGPSGCGKSTLLRLVAGLDELTSGKILINKECVNEIPPAKRDMAMVFQSYALYPHMSVFENMAYSLKLRKYTKPALEKIVKDTAALLKLEPFLDRKPHELSGGQRQRVAMGRAIVRSPAVFLFDEPLSNLDAALRTEMRHEIKKLHQQLATTCLYVTHDQTEAMTMANRIVVLNHGVIEQIGRPHDLYLRPASIFVAGFTGHYPMNFISAMLNSRDTLILDSGVMYQMEQAIHGVSIGEKILCAVRAEHLQFQENPSDQTITARIEFIDDMGADKLIQGLDIKTGGRLTVRVKADWQQRSEQIHLSLPEKNIHLFNPVSGMRLGEAG